MWERSHDRRRKDGRGSEGKAETRLQELFEAAHRDRNLKMRLLSHTEAVAKEWGVEIGGRGSCTARKVGAFAELADEAKHGTLFRVPVPEGMLSIHTVATT